MLLHVSGTRRHGISATAPAVALPVPAGGRPLFAVALAVLTYAVGVAVAVLAGFAPAPHGWQLTATLGAAPLLGWAASRMIRIPPAEAVDAPATATVQVFSAAPP
jgi:hypothetical protein